MNRWRNRLDSLAHSGNSSPESTTEMDTSIEEENEEILGNGGRQMSELREQIAKEMWRDYNLYLERQARYIEKKMPTGSATPTESTMSSSSPN